MLSLAIAFATGGLLAGILLSPFGFTVWGALGGLAFAWFWRTSQPRAFLAGLVPWLLFLGVPSLVLFPRMDAVCAADALCAAPRPPSFLWWGIAGLACGAATGAAFAWAWRRPRAMPRLAITGGLGFGLPMLLPGAYLDGLFWPTLGGGNVLAAVLAFAIAGAIGGACIGQASAEIERRHAESGPKLHPETASSASDAARPTTTDRSQ